jgi:uncharacterized damage-inducible protein DinB
MDNELASLFLNYSCKRLDMVAANMKACLGRLSDEQVWARGGAHENAVGNLVLHLCGNIQQWIMHGVGGTKDIRVRETEFGTEGGLSAAVLAEMFAVKVADAQGVIASLPAERLSERTSPQPGRPEVSVLEAIYLVVAHAHEHTGQVIVLTKQMTGNDLDLSVPRPR